MERSFNARPAKSLNQRPGIKKPMPSEAQQAYANQNAYANSKPANNTIVNNPASQPVKQTVKPVQNAGSVTRTIRSNISQAANVSEIDETVEVMRAMVGGFANIDDATIKKNIELLGSNGMSNEDKTISFECVDYLMSNFGYIVMGLVLDAAFKDAFVEAVSCEVQIDTSPEDIKQEARKNMHADITYESKGSIILGVTTFMPATQKSLFDKMQKSFDELDPYANEFDDAVEKLSNDAKNEYGFIFSNFAYMMRAFTHNNLFMTYVITVVDKVKSLINN